ncbi:MAG: alpha/beta hydrolase domain-containing protein [Alphaproteobacteria bacterium]
MTNRIELRIAERTPFADGNGFGGVGPYERLWGRAHYAIDPAAPAQAGIVDIDRAERGTDGLVRFAADLMILRPAEAARGNGRVFFDWGNRGNMRAVQFFCDAPASNEIRTAAHAGNGFLFRRGYTVVHAAWQGDLLPGGGRTILDLPVAAESDGPLTGQVRTEFIANGPGVKSMPLSGRVSTRSHPTVSRDTREARLTRRRYPYDRPELVPADAWAFARMESGAGLDMQGTEQAVIPSDTDIYLKDGFEPGWIYELVYTGRDPLVMALGHVVVRDLVSFLKYREADDAGQPNPAGRIEKAYGWGRSQTGRAIRDFVHLGFNADAEGRRVFDGVLPHVAGAGRMWLNHRFANGVNPAGQQYEDHFNCADRFPFSYAESTDHLTGRTDAILKRPATDPLVIHTQTATEYWQRRGSLVHTDTRGNDLPQPEGVRVFLWASSQHYADPNVKGPARGVYQNLQNTVATSMLFRAMLDALDRWASDGTPPPASRVPSRADGTLATMEAWRAQFPAIPGVALPSEPAGLPLLDFGPDFEAGILREPPEIVSREGYAVLVPAVDADGNDVPGVRVPMVQAPLGTFTGWNLRRRGLGHGAMHEFTGSYIPFPDTEAEREATGDPRASVLARYGDAAGYVRASVEAARRLVAEGLMLEEDVARVEAAARDWGRPRHELSLKG